MEISVEENVQSVHFGLSIGSLLFWKKLIGTEIQILAAVI